MPLPFASLASPSARLREACDELWDRLVDPREPYADDDGPWLDLAPAAGDPPPYTAGAASEIQLREIRRQCRALALTNEFAINGHENRISYLVGPGHTYRATWRKGVAPRPDDLPAQVQHQLDAFLDDQRWHRRQQEIVRRLDRDGEVFLRFWSDDQGQLQVRCIEPGQVVTPPRLAADPAASFGILTETHDVETPLAYFVDGQPLEAHQVQHRKAQVDANVKRGLPLFFPVRKNLRRAEKLLRNMSVVAEIQSAIALIRKHRGASRSGVAQFVAAQADPPAGPAPAPFARRFLPGTILDAHGNVDYDFPAAGLDAGNYVTVLQAELRAIASRLVMPEFMLTSDASNANFASTRMAEGPALRLFARLQADLVADDLQVMRRVVAAAVSAGRLPAAALHDVAIEAAPPSLEVRDPRHEAYVHRLEFEAGILSAQTWSRRRGLDYEQEQAHRAAHARDPLA